MRHYGEDPRDQVQDPQLADVTGNNDDNLVAITGSARLAVAAVSSYIARVGCVLRAPLRIVAAMKGAEHEADEPRPSWYPVQFEELTDGCEAHLKDECRHSIGYAREGFRKEMWPTSVTRVMELNEMTLHSSAVSWSWLAVNDALKSLRGQPDYSCYGNAFDPMRSTAREIMFHGWTSQSFNFFDEDDLYAVDDPSMFLHDTEAWMFMNVPDWSDSEGSDEVWSENDDM